MTDPALLASLPPERRLALSYAPQRARHAWAAFYALDARLDGIVRKAREPMLAQIKLAWWRERLLQPAGARPQGEPVLAALAAWQGHEGRLTALVDGWEAVLAAEAAPSEGLRALALARGESCAALAAALGQPGAEDSARRAGQQWAAAEWMTATAINAAELAEFDWNTIRLPRDLRPLAVHAGLARRSKRSGFGPPRPVDLLVAMRLGVLGI